MDMTVAQSLCVMDRGRLQRLRGDANRIAAGFAAAALSIDDGLFRQAQHEMLATINDFASLGDGVDEETVRVTAAIRSRLPGLRHQTVALRACLDLVAAAAARPRPYALGERIGRLCGALAEQDAAQRLALAA